MIRRLIAGLVVIGLAVGVWLLWPEEEASMSTTTAVASPTTVPATPTSSAPPVVTPDPSTTSTTEGNHVVETTEEAEAILRELWFGWFEGIYNQDEDRIREVVATEEQVRAAVDQFGSMEFSTAPQVDLIDVSEAELLRRDEECIALWAHLDISAFRPGATGSEGVYVLRHVDNRWLLLSVWPNRGDLWDQDCDVLLEL